MSSLPLEKYGLQSCRAEIEAVAQDCIVGVPVITKSTSWFGGLPAVDPGFVWPTKNGVPLCFIGQLDCSAIELLPLNHGYLLFFYDNRHWGYRPEDKGHAVVIHQNGEKELTHADLPEYQANVLFGLWKRRVKPRVYARVNVQFKNGISFPSYQRDEPSFHDEDLVEQYIEFCCDFFHHDIQIGGYPIPIQNDEMERDCIRAFGFGELDDWILLLQLFEVGDMIWGDAGALYWFIHRDDLAAARFDRIWMVTQCH